MTPKQVQKYWRTWSAICIAQGWNSLSSAEKDVRRKLTHVKCGLVMPDGSARSMTSFQNRDFSRWLAGTAHLLNQVDIRDRDRENTVWSVTRLAEALETVIGHDYARSIVIDWRDTTDLDKFPLEDPLQFPRDENGKIDARDAGRMLDLDNLRNVLKNRLGRIIQKIRDGKMQPGPACPSFYKYSQDEIIWHLVNKKEILPPGVKPAQAPDQPKRKYVLQGATTKLSPHVARSAGPVKHNDAKPKVVNGELMSGHGISTDSPAPAGNPAGGKSPAAPSYCMHKVPPPSRRPVAASPVLQTTIEPDPF
jgi:hypothetical protein